MTDQTIELFSAGSGLTTVQSAQLAELEAVIERGLQTFVDVGTALLTIRDNRLYRETHGTFEDYCRERWGMVASRARQLIAAAETVENLQTVTNVTLPVNEGQARPLMRLQPDQQREAWAKAVETAPNGKVTAAHVQAVVDEYKAQAEERSADVDAYDWAEDEPASEPEPEIEPMVEPVTATPPVSVPEPSKMAVHFSSESPEHYTPAGIIEAAVACMGAIDLDPCSNSHETPNVPATNHYTVADDGLAKPWHGRVYMNPPYGREISAWVDKLVSEYDRGNVTAAIALVPARTDTQWWLKMRDFPVCLVVGRLTFVGNDDPAPFPSAVFYLGNDLAAFYYAFNHMGDIWQRIEPDMFGA